MKLLWNISFVVSILLLEINGQSLRSRFKHRPSANYYLSTSTSTTTESGDEAFVEASSSRAPFPSRSSLLRHQFGTSSSAPSASPTDEPAQKINRRPTRKTTPIPVPPAAQLSQTEATQGYLREVISGGANNNASPRPTTTSKTTPSSSPPPQQNSYNDDADDELIRKGLIEKLCNKKYGISSTPLAETTTAAPQIRSTTSTTTIPPSTSSDRTNPLRRSRVRVPRRVSRSTTASTSTTTSAPSTTSTTTEAQCSDFDHLTLKQLMKRVKGGLRRKPKPQE